MNTTVDARSVKVFNSAFMVRLWYVSFTVRLNAFMASLGTDKSLPRCLVLCQYNMEKRPRSQTLPGW